MEKKLSEIIGKFQVNDPINIQKMRETAAVQLSASEIRKQLHDFVDQLPEEQLEKALKIFLSVINQKETR